MDKPGDLGRSPTPKPKRRWIRWLRWPLVAYLIVCLIMMALENSLIFFPSAYPEGFWTPLYFEAEDAWFNAADGTRLHGWYVPHDNPRAVVLFAHGNAGNLSHRADIVHTLNSRMRCSVMIFDYRGYGRSEGKPNEAGVLADARAAREWLGQRAGIAESQIVLMGESIGGAVVVDLAAKDGARGLVIENTFSSLPEVAGYHYPWLPAKLLMRTRLNSAAKIRNYHGPLLQAHGDHDTIVPLAIGKRLFEAANEPKQFILVPGGDHNDPRSEAFFQALNTFLEHLPAMNESDR